jgi:hypothetical protein
MYVDEPGDRGWGNNASLVVVLSTVAVKATQDPILRVIL